MLDFSKDLFKKRKTTDIIVCEKSRINPGDVLELSAFTRAVGSSGGGFIELKIGSATPKRVSDDRNFLNQAHAHRYAACQNCRYRVGYPFFIPHESCAKKRSVRFGET